MSHYTVTVVLPEAPKSPQHVEELLEPLLAPFNEEIQVEPYKDYANTDHDRWPLVVVKENAPEIDLDDLHAVAAFMNKRYAGEEQYGVDEQGLYSMSTYNPDSKWDWWAVGGRWNGFYTMRDASGVEYKGNWGRKGDIVVDEGLITYAVLAEGVWRSPGKMGWFGASTEEDDDRSQFSAWFKKFWNELGDDAWVAVVDLHI